MKEKILAALKTKFVGVQDSILNRVADKLAKTVTTDEAIVTAVEGVSMQQLIDSYADSRATEAASTALKNHRAKLGLDENDQPINPGDDEDKDKNKKKKTDPDEPAWFTKFKEDQQKTIDGLVQKVTGFEKEKTTTELSGRLLSKLKEKGIPESYFKGRNLIVEKEDAIDTLVTSIETDFNGFKQEMAEQGVNISIPPAAGGPPNVGADLGKSAADRKNAKPSEGVGAKKL